MPQRSKCHLGGRSDGSQWVHSPHSTCAREALRGAERRDGVLAGELADLQRQLLALMAQPLPLPASRSSSRASSRQGSRPSTARGPAPGAPAQPAAAVTAAGPAAAAKQVLPTTRSSASPRIQAVHVSSSADASAAAGGGGDSLAPAARPGSRQEQHRAQLLAEMARKELQREGERAALMAECSSDGDRRRLQALFELERRNAMALMQQLATA